MFTFIDWVAYWRGQNGYSSPSTTVLNALGSCGAVVVVLNVSNHAVPVRIPLTSTFINGAMKNYAMARHSR